MVVINVKRTDNDQFLYECSVADSNDKVIRDLCMIWNMRERLARLCGAVEELAKHGPMKPESERGIDEIAERDGRAPAAHGPHYAADPLGMRTGDAPPPGLADVLRRTAADAHALVSKATFAAGMALTLPALQERLDNIRGAVIMAYPMSLPPFDTVRLFIEDPDDGFLQEQMGQEYMDPATATLWWAGKEFFRDQNVGDRVGRNEKTKVVAKLQKRAGGPPAREPAVSEEERKAMMAFYFKKQEEEKALAEDADDTYLGAAWANPRALKSSLLGTGSIGWRPAAGRP